jgi:phosphate-selective porin OprO/OprP
MKSTSFPKFLPVAALVAFASVVPAAELTLQEQIDALKARLQELDSKVRPLQRAETTAGDKGFILASPDAANSLRVRGLIQADSRWFFDKSIENDAILLRRARIGLEGKFGKTTDYQITGEFAGSSATILDANVTPVGLEQLQPDFAQLFTERSVVSQLLPNRDLGVQVGGDLFDGRVSFAVGVFNGTTDGGNNTSQTDSNDGKSLAARVTFQPWVKDKESLLSGLTFGLGGTYGLEDANGVLATGFKTDGQQTFYSYRTAGATGTTTAVTSNGKVWRLTPQVSYYRGSFGFIGEYVTSSSDIKAVNTTTSTSVVNSTKTVNLKNHAWQIQASYVLTGEEAGYKGVTPANDFDRAAGTWGAFEVVGRLSSIKFDDQAFAGASANFQIVDPAKSARSADTLGVGLNWYLSKVARLSFDYEYTRFQQAAGASAPAATSVISKPERALLTRFSLNF